jgi:hypothetical protein
VRQLKQLVTLHKDVAPAEKLPRKIARTFTFEHKLRQKVVVTTVGTKAPITITQVEQLWLKGGFFEGTRYAIA